MEFTLDELKAMHNLIQDTYEENELEGWTDADKSVLLSAMRKIHSDMLRMPSKVGHWRTDKVAFYYTCSVCGCCVKQDTNDVMLEYHGKYNYCPRCGSKMSYE